MRLILTAAMFVATALAAQSPAPTNQAREIARLQKENDSLRVRIAELSPQPKPQAAAPGMAALPSRTGAMHPGTVTEKFDEFKNITVVMLKDLPLVNGLKLIMIYTMPGRTPSRSASILFEFFKQANTWEYLQCHQVDMLAGGKALDLPPSVHDGTVGSGYVLEYVRSTMSVNDAIRLAASPDSKMRLCTTEYAFGDLDRVAIADFLSRMAP